MRRGKEAASSSDDVPEEEKEEENPTTSREGRQSDKKRKEASSSSSSSLTKDSGKRHKKQQPLSPPPTQQHASSSSNSGGEVTVWVRLQEGANNLFGSSVSVPTSAPNISTLVRSLLGIPKDTIGIEDLKRISNTKVYKVSYLTPMQALSPSSSL